MGDRPISESDVILQGIRPLPDLGMTVVQTGPASAALAELVRRWIVDQYADGRPVPPWTLEVHRRLGGRPADVRMSECPSDARPAVGASAGSSHDDLDAGQTADVLGLTRRHVLRLAAEGAFGVGARQQPNRQWRFDPGAVARYARRHAP